jgi:hypothetical protein
MSRLFPSLAVKGAFNARILPAIILVAFGFALSIPIAGLITSYNYGQIALIVTNPDGSPGRLWFGALKRRPDHVVTLDECFQMLDRMRDDIKTYERKVTSLKISMDCSTGRN